MKGLITGLVWDDANAEALDHAVLDTPKVSKSHLEKMCALTGVKYTSPEKDIDLIQMLANLIDLGIGGAKKMCEIVHIAHSKSLIASFLHSKHFKIHEETSTWYILRGM